MAGDGRFDSTTRSSSFSPSASAEVRSSSSPSASMSEGRREGLRMGSGSASPLVGGWPLVREGRDVRSEAASVGSRGEIRVPLTSGLAVGKVRSRMKML